MAFNRIKAMVELFKLLRSGTRKVKVQNHIFLRGNLIRVLQEEGWFDYLNAPRSFNEIAEHFQYTDIDFLKYLLLMFSDDNTLKVVNGSKYQTVRPLNDEWVLPRIFDEAMGELWIGFSKALPDRLRGNHVEFTGGIKLFDWDNTLINNLYNQIRLSAFAFANILKKPVKFLDAGCGNGYGTSQIWTYYYRKKHFYNGSPMKVVGIDRDENLLNIAKNEISIWLKKFSGLNDDEIKSSEQYFPEFKLGSVEKLPFDDNTFDVTYTSLILHWTNAQEAIKELIRVTKPNGLYFGVQSFFPLASKFANVYCKLIENTTGFFYKEDFIKWAKEAGAINIEFVSPLTVFKMTKGAA